MVAEKTKIALISTTLSAGGAERFAGMLGIMLEKLNYEIHHIVINSATDFHFNGKLLNLGILGSSNISIVKKIKKGFILRQYLNQNNIYLIIDNRTRNNFFRELIAQFIFGKRKKIAIIHSFQIDQYLPKSIFLAKILYRKTHKLICVSKAIEQKIIDKYHFKNTETIYNSVDFSEKVIVIPKNLPEKYILFYGRLEEKVKHFNLLLEGFSKSKIYEIGYQLLILGDGPDTNLIKNKIENLGLKAFVQLIPFTPAPFGYVKSAKFIVLTSYYEGFPMCIIESLALGTPVVAVDCNSGPKEIIVTNHNGLLVENHNSTALANAIKKLTDDPKLYAVCKTNAVLSCAHLSPEIISNKWKNVLS